MPCTYLQEATRSAVSHAQCAGCVGRAHSHEQLVASHESCGFGCLDEGQGSRLALRRGGAAVQARAVAAARAEARGDVGAKGGLVVEVLAVVVLAGPGAAAVGEHPLVRAHGLVGHAVQLLVDEIVAAAAQQQQRRPVAGFAAEAV